MRRRLLRHFLLNAVRLVAFPIAVGMLACRTLVNSSPAPREVLRPEGLLLACWSLLATAVVDRLQLALRGPRLLRGPMMPGFFLFHAARAVVELVSIGPSAPATLLTSIVTSGATAFLIIMAMAFGLIRPHMLFERFNDIRKAVGHPHSTETMNRAAGEKATSSQDAQMQQRASPPPHSKPRARNIQQR